MITNLQSLAYIVEVAHSGSITKAAQNLFLSQPYLSNIIRNIEQDIGILLFTRSARGVELTDDGKEFIKKSKSILREVDELENMFYLEEDDLKLSISYTRSYQVTKCLSEYLEKQNNRDKLLVRFKETNPFQVVLDVHKRTSDFGVLHFYDAQLEYFLNIFKKYDLEYKQKYKRPFLLAMSNKNKLASKAEITADMLKNQTTIAYGDYESSDASFSVIEEVSDLVMSKKRVYAYDRATLMELLSGNSNAYMWLTGLHTRSLKQYDIVLKECKDVNVYDLGFEIYPSYKSLSATGLEVLKALQNIDWNEKI